MHLIVAEKNLSAQRIARILAGNGRVETERHSGVNLYRFDQTVAIGLRGHVVEVDFEEGYEDWRRTDRPPRSLIDAPTTKRVTEKNIVRLLTRKARDADRVTIATDFDTEGELIGKEAYEIIRAANPDVRVYRARFSAITHDEIREAFRKPTELDFDLAAAGEARQIIDLIWGASLTRFITIAARRGGASVLSVGRVQSPTLAMIVDREKEIESFVPEPYWELTIRTKKGEEEFTARHQKGRFTEKGAAQLARERTAAPVTVVDVKEGTKKDRAPPPFDTTSFLVAAARIGFQAASAMRIAEDLYINGFISYPRTDNTVYPASLHLDRILDELMRSDLSSEVSWVREHRRSTPTRGRRSSTDHPPIHPTAPATRSTLGEQRWKIYELVVRRFLATLSPDAEWATSKYRLDAGGEIYISTGARVIKQGWRRVYPYIGGSERYVPHCEVGDELPLIGVSLEEKETKPPGRYSQSSLIKRMEELGLGTKSTRHEVIAKLISRRYITGNPLRPTLVGRAVTEALEHHADTITKPDMTRQLEEHMQQIRERKRRRDEVIDESRQILHRIFDQLERHESEIGEEIRERTAEDRTVGRCPVCGNDLRIRFSGGSQFIGCSGYPECTFNISLPATVWGRAVRTEKVCPEHGLRNVRLVKRGSRPWDLGCPLCNHIRSNREALLMIPGISEDDLPSLYAHHRYTAQDICRAKPDELASELGTGIEEAEKMIDGAGKALERLRKRSEMRRFIRERINPRKGRSPSKVVQALIDQGIEDIQALAGATEESLKKANIGPKEREMILRDVRAMWNERALREAGVPPVSLKKYREAGITDPEQFVTIPIPYLAEVTGINPETVHKHVSRVCAYLGRPVPPRMTRRQFERGRNELLGIPGIGEAYLRRLFSAGICDAATLKAADAGGISKKTGIPVGKLREIQRRMEERD
ncbi:MAG: DNA topoisomerase I [Methanoculleaceae archaeon]